MEPNMITAHPTSHITATTAHLCANAVHVAVPLARPAGAMALAPLGAAGVVGVEVTTNATQTLTATTTSSAQTTHAIPASVNLPMITPTHAMTASIAR